MKTLGVILARGGSQGLKSKHLLPLAGRALIGHTFADVHAARRLTHVVVSSDCPRVLALAAGNGFEVIRRPAELATGEASVQDVLLHALDFVEARGEIKFDAVATLYGNVPVRPAGVIDEAITLLATARCDSVRSFCPVGKWHPDWLSKIEGDRALALRPGSIHRRQDLEPLFLHDGAIVVSSRASMEAGRANRSDPHAFFGTDRRAVRTEFGAAVEVDTRRDLLLAEAILRERREALEASAA
jgi:CMP-N,N'-diacetyllegionaminic acid synthase